VPTATGAYATAALVKARLFAAGVTDTADDTLIGTICDQVNQFIESPQGTGRKVSAGTSGADYFLRPSDQDRAPGWPAMWVYLSDKHPRRYFAFGRDTISMTATCGWTAIPDDIIDVAVTTAVRAWHARQSGQADIVGNDENGSPLVSRYVSGYHWATLKAYRVAPPVG
jgi:hypothetical protein